MLSISDDHQFGDWGTLLTRPSEFGDPSGEVGGQAGQILSWHGNLDASSAQALDQSYGGGNRRRSAWVGEHSNAANLKRMTVRGAHLPQHRAALAVVLGTRASASTGSDGHRQWSSSQEREKLDIARRPGQPARHDCPRLPTPLGG